MQAKVVLPSDAGGSTVNMWMKPERNSGLVTRVPVGSTVDVVKDRGTWIGIRFQGYAGWMMANYLEYLDEDGNTQTEESSTEGTITAEEMMLIADAITELDNAARILTRCSDILGKIFGRG